MISSVVLYGLGIAVLLCSVCVVVDVVVRFVCELLRAVVRFGCCVCVCFCVRVCFNECLV